MTPPVAAVVLAAGQGKRMASPLAKVLHEVGGRPMVHLVVDAARAAGAEPVVVVVGHQAGAVRASFGEDAAGVRFALQPERRGTGQAAALGLDALGRREGDVLVLCGDVPLIRSETLADLLRRHRAARAAATVLTMVVGDPSGYGRVLREGGPEGLFLGTVEDVDATAEQRAVREVNTGTYAFDLAFLAAALPRLRAENRQGEYYLPDALPLAVAEGRAILAVRVADAEEAMGVNTPEDLEKARRLFAARALR